MFLASSGSITSVAYRSVRTSRTVRKLKTESILFFRCRLKKPSKHAAQIASSTLRG